MGEFRYEERITRRMVKAELGQSIFVFGDNMLHIGYGGQAKEMRGELNAIGIPTKRRPAMNPEDFFSDRPEELAAVCRAIHSITERVQQGQNIVWPTHGIGTGFARIHEKSPKIAAFLQSFEEVLFAVMTIDKPKPKYQLDNLQGDDNDTSE